MNYDLWSYIIYVGLGYLFNHVVSTKFVIDCSFVFILCYFEPSSNRVYHGNGLISVSLPLFLWCK